LDQDSVGSVVPDHEFGSRTDPPQKKTCFDELDDFLELKNRSESSKWQF
jgi:hypothetical protein